ncbi:MAG: DUF2179 domain-containing protein, partial [Chloroflexota bacterium]
FGSVKELMPEISIPPLTGAVLGAALFIFVLRVVGVALSTVRVLVMMRGQKLWSVVLGFFEVLVYVVAIGQVVSNLSNVWNILGYCLGFSVGTLVGMALDEKLVLGYANVRIVSRNKAQQLADNIRGAGFGATVGWASGRTGTVGVVTATVRRKEVSHVCRLADKADPNAFVTVEEARAVRRGYMHMAQREK